MLIWECNHEDWETYIQKEREFQEEREKYPDKYPKLILEDKYGYAMLDKAGTVTKSFNVYEVENEQQILDMTLFWSSIHKMKWIALISRHNASITFIDFIKKRSSNTVNN
jgi:hypothetical protein